MSTTSSVARASSVIGPLLLVAAVAAAAPAAGADKTAVVDGSVVHDVGRLLCNITNFGLIGSQYGSTAHWSDAPSCRWPGVDGREHLWSAGLWVGAVKLGEELVSTGQYELELLPTDAPEDTIYRAYEGAPGGDRFPLADADDDGDGLEDEDPLNGLDDDGDGLIDEDYAAISDQYFRCKYQDTMPGAPADHTPLGIEVVQRTMQWSDPLLQDAIGLEFAITNTGVTTLSDVYVGFFADPDIAATDDPGEGQDDLAGIEEYPTGVPDGRGRLAPTLYTAYMLDSKSPVATGYIGVVALGQKIGEGEGAVDEAAEVNCARIISGQTDFANGGDPTNDAERYELLSTPQAVPIATTADPGDYRLLVGLGPFGDLAPGQVVTVRFALAVAADALGLEAVAREIDATYRGASCLRSDTLETVRWLTPSQWPTSTPPAAAGLYLEASPNPFNPRLEVGYRLDRAGRVRLSLFDVRGRRVADLFAGEREAGEFRAVWDGRDAAGRPAASGVYQLRLEGAGGDVRKLVTLVR